MSEATWRMERRAAYQERFGLHTAPFAPEPPAGVIVPLPSHEGTIHRIRYALEYGVGPVLVTGPSGVGKSTLAEHAARSFGGTIARLPYPALPPEELPLSIAAALGLELASTGSAVSVARIRELVSTAGAGTNVPVLLVEDGHLIQDERALDALGSLAQMGLRVVMIGASELMLRLPPMLADRLAACCLVEPLEPAEAAAYVLGRLASAGAREPLFEDRHLEQLHASTDGVARRLNRVADIALLLAATTGLPRPDDRCVALAIRECTPPWRLAS